VNPDQVGRGGVLVENRSGRKRMVREWCNLARLEKWEYLLESDKP
jgi:hypothetical protein